VVQRQAAEGGAARTPLAEAIWYYHFYIDQMGFTAQDLGGTKVRLTGPGGKADLIDITFDAQAPRMVRIWHSDESYTVTEYDFAARRWEERARHIKMEEYDRELSIGERIGIGVSSTAKLAGGVGACVLGTAETVGFGAVAACAYGADLAASGIREVAGGDDRTLVNQAATAGLSQFIDPQTAQELTNTAEATANIMMGAYGAAKPLPAPKVTPGGMAPAAAAGLTTDVPVKGVSVPASEMPPNRGPANLNAANDLALARQKAAATARPPGETQVQARPVLATGTGDMAPARVIEAGEAAHDQGALDTRMGKKPTPPVGGSKAGGSKAGGPVRPAETAAGGRTPAAAATVRAAKGLPTAEEDAIVQRYARGLADLRERVQALRTQNDAKPWNQKLRDRARLAYESADRALQGIEDEAVTRGEGELVDHLDPLVKERGKLNTPKGLDETDTGKRVPCDAVAQAPKALRGMDFADIERAMGRPPDEVVAKAREVGHEPSGHQIVTWKFKDKSMLRIDAPRELGNRPASADRPHAELHGPKGQRLDQQGIVVPERSISAHMTITDYTFALENHFGPARAGGG
jgi:hypothetical protein